jgi:hypothetical protein
LVVEDVMNYKLIYILKRGPVVIMLVFIQVLVECLAIPLLALDRIIEEKLDNLAEEQDRKRGM